MIGLISFLLTAVIALSGTYYKSGLCDPNAQAASVLEARRAYRDVMEYDENAPVSYAEIEALYRREALKKPLKEAISRLFSLAEDVRLSRSAEEYSLFFFYTGERGKIVPEGIIEAEIWLMPFTHEEARAFDALCKADEQALTQLYTPVLLRAEAAKQKGLSSENGFEPYLFTYESAPVARHSAFLSEDILKAIFVLTEPGELSPPIRDARGIVYVRAASKKP